MDGIDPTNGKPLPTDADVDAALSRLARFKSKSMTSSQTDQELRDSITHILGLCQYGCDGTNHKSAAREDEEAEIDQIIALIKADRQKMIEKLSFHLGVDVKTLEGYLQAKDY